jgi:hypothetical protein
VNRDGVQHIHLTSTKYFDAINERRSSPRGMRDQEVVSENAQVIAGYLAGSC